MQQEKAALIRALNDRLRVNRVGGRILMTRGIVARGPVFVVATLLAMRGYSEFDEGNDPYGEHDFGGLEIDGQRVFWKIDYYDATLTYGAQDPSDEATCQRVLTLMLATEY